MILTNFFTRKKTLTTANIAKERLQIVIDKENTKNKLLFYNTVNLKNDLIQVIQKYINEPKDILIQFKKQNKHTAIIECDIFFLNKNI